MSATNRGTIREGFDFYPTPINTINKFLDNYNLGGGVIFEPCAGNGNFIKAIRDKGYTNTIIANELREEEQENLIENGANEVYIHNFLEDKIDIEPNVIITNPPFSIAKEFIEKCRTDYPNAKVVMLLRLAFLESKRRKEFWDRHPVNHLYVLSERPRFINNKSDATAYAWFVWDNSDEQTIHII